jgi:hypothetical protein
VKYLLSTTASLAIAGCISLPPITQPMCETNADCDTANGEICGEGVCWGDPPEGMYAVRIGPPPDRDDLVPTEITAVEIHDNGWIQTPLVLETALVVSGTVSLDCPAGANCPEPLAGLAAQVTISRPARIRGGPAFIASATTTAESPAFAIKIPRGLPGEEYFVTASPIRDPMRPQLDRVAPGRLVIFPTDTPPPLDLRLGAELNLVTGVVTDAGGVGIRDARVVVRGRWEATGPEVELSSIGTTDQAGRFDVFLPSSPIDPAARLVVTPHTVYGEVQPTLIHELTVTGDPVITVTGSLVMPDYPEPQLVTIPIRGTSTEGDYEPIAGAQVTLVGEELIERFPPTLPPVVARIEATGTTDPQGNVQLFLIPSSEDLAYQLHVKPPPASGAAQYAGVYGAAINVDAGSSTLAEVYVANQVAIRGQLLGFHDGQPAEGMVVTATANRGFAGTLVEDLQRELAEAVPTSETTNSDGSFAIFVDPEIAGVPVVYDVRFEPSANTLLPIWQPDPIEIDPVSGYDLGTRTLPAAAYVRGDIKDADEARIGGADVRLYTIPALIVACDTCPDAAVLRAHATSGLSGVVHLVLSDE